MIGLHCFEKEWIDSFRRQKGYEKINPPLLEKMIHALSLLQHLQTQSLHFIFKGGTSLMLLLDKTTRFSVDIDIITEESRETIEEVLDKVIGTSHFVSWRLDRKRSYKPGIPKAHYELEYDSRVNKNSNYILLDILFEKAHYPILQQRPVLSFFIETATLIPVNVPTVEGITGDKLTAFAPTTTGILYGKGKELEMIKQLYDLGNLFNHIQSLQEVANSFSAFAAQEIAYRDLTIKPADILRDSLDTCRIIGFRNRSNTEPDKSRFAELQRGIASFSEFPVAGSFRIDEAITAAAKVSYLCAKLLTENNSALERYDQQNISDLSIKNPQWNALNKLKRLPDQAAFYYWYKCLELLGRI
ncbi:MAG: nucleotidyl transferase AbiEii/AbiGii toxin family protein [Chitinophagaceae bacterium]|nr:nucleotidyl transferase AbiEii/AbiGii toxin family protein [Chitinophagaceae bacterium]